MATVANISEELLEAYETLRAIRDGEVDAFVLLTQGGYRVETLSSSDAPYRVLVEAMRDGALTVDEHGIVSYCNPPFAGAVGQPSAEIIGHCAWDWIELELPFAEILARAKTGEVRCDGWVRTANDRVPVAVTALELATDAPSMLICLVLADLRDRVAAEALRVQQREHERRERMREAFVGILGHDLRTPLAAIMNGAHLLEHATLPSQRMTRIAAGMRRSAERMQRLIDDMLDLTLGRIGGGIPLNPAPLDLKSTVDAALAELKARAPDVRCELSSTGDTHGEWDPERLQQVLTNLLSNAVEHGDKDEPVQIRLCGDELNVQLAVHNTGTPIPRETLAHVFEPFRRGEHGTPARGRGVGLGLYIAERIVSAHGGTIEVSSSDAGTTFTVSLPRRVPKVLPSEPPAADTQ